MRSFQDFLANELQSQFDKLSNQARFVKMIVDKELAVSNRKKAEIIEELRRRSSGHFLRWQRRKPREKPRTPKTVQTMRPRRRPRAAHRQITITFWAWRSGAHKREDRETPSTSGTAQVSYNSRNDTEARQYGQRIKGCPLADAGPLDGP
ncbi:hypothetical protein BGY98DRAFT_616152 [Russula aff. rugulosa BPL654]|nr:hypothetical protein BGY98DRAFT_616152 [Russula aff. rugulosa BPL654]